MEKDDKKILAYRHRAYPLGSPGVPNEINSHPHNSQNGKISVVHNGIIENYLELKNMLHQKRAMPSNQTDTEVVAQHEDL